MPLGFTQPLTEMNTTTRKIMFLGNKARAMLRVDNSPPSVIRLSRQCGILNLSQPYRPPRPVTRIFFFILYGSSISMYVFNFEMLWEELGGNFATRRQ
jgi:hypothetical protein